VRTAELAVAGPVSDAEGMADGAVPLEEYALLGDTRSAALVSSHGSVDWLCWPNFDDPSCFAALLGTAEHGRWLLAPAGGGRASRRRYADGLVLETTFETVGGAVTVVDCMPVGGGERADLVRLVRGDEGRVDMRMELLIRFDYGRVAPWVRRMDGRMVAVGGPDGLTLTGPVPFEMDGGTGTAEFAVRAGDVVPFTLTWFPSHEPIPEALDAEGAVDDTRRWWRGWTDTLRSPSEWPDAVRTSLVVLKGLTYGPTGGVIAAPTTSLPERLGGSRNWDYRYVWLRDATFTLDALLDSGYTEEASAWRDWLLRAVAGDPSTLRILYGLAGQRRLPEMELDWLPGYAGSRPVRVGNAASTQFQLDVYGEVLDALSDARRAGLPPDDAAWDLERALLEDLERRWTEPDEGLWEVRSQRRHFTHSKVLAWVGFDRAVKTVERYGLEGPGDRWRALRDEIHAEVCREGYDERRGAFVQSYGSHLLDASLLLLPLVGFLPAGDPRVRGTVEAIERELLDGGLVHRYEHSSGTDGFTEPEGAFLLCSFWLADCRHLMGRRREARDLFERLLDLRNDVGLLAEQYDVAAGRLVGNFPQAFSHVGLVNTARALSAATSGTRRSG
jgi:GH15 family glucan-1,4-alpha-glucosidase